MAIKNNTPTQSRKSLTQIRDVTRLVYSLLKNLSYEFGEFKGEMTLYISEGRLRSASITPGPETVAKLMGEPNLQPLNGGLVDRAVLKTLVCHRTNRLKSAVQCGQCAFHPCVGPEDAWTA
jgi:hypothetical protein